MKFRLLAAVAAPVFLVSCALLPERGMAADEGFVSLFDGNTLSGWTNMKGEAPGAGWQVVDGTIHRADKAGDLYSEKTYGDFEFRFEWKVAPASNSGVKYRVSTYGKRLLGPEYQVLDDDKHPNGKNPLTRAAAMYALFPTNEAKELKPVGEWNTGKVICKGMVLQHWLNGRKVLEVDTTSEAWKTAVANSKYKNIENYGSNPEGRLMLQDHSDPVWYRNLRIKEL